MSRYLLTTAALAPLLLGAWTNFWSRTLVTSAAVREKFKGVSHGRLVVRPGDTKTPERDNAED